MQISQVSQGLAHWVTCVQGGHLAGLSKSAAVQLAARRMVGPPGMAQQPKQSQPFGTSGWQRFTQLSDWEADVEHSVVCWAA